MRDLPAAKVIQAILDWPRAMKRAVALSIDLSLCAISVYLAFYLRLGEWVDPLGDPLPTIVASMAIAVPIFIVAGLYRAIFRYAGWHAIVAIMRAVVLYGFVFATVYTVFGIPGTPRTVGLIQPILLFMMVGSTRLAARVVFEESYTARWKGADVERVLIFGAGTAGRELARTLSSSRQMRLTGFVDDDPRLSGAQLEGVPIYHSSRLDHAVRHHRAAGVLLALPKATGHRRREILADLKQLGIHVRTLPSMTDVAHGKITVNDLKELDVADLLGRPVVPPDRDLLARLIQGRTVMVTGAGGSIGSELCRQLVAVQPACLILVDQCEYNLYAIHREISQLWSGGAAAGGLIPIIASVCDETRMSKVFGRYRPSTVYHAAACKHVPLVEHNLVEGLRNNVIGTYTTAKLARAHGVSDFVLISTDKAVRPTNAMGASKRCAEMIVQAMDADSTSTRYAMVRFGNVLGSSGSVVPLFRAQVEAGGPITLTHPDITRFFMSIPEAAQLVLQAGAMASGGDVFVLDMGEPVRIRDLAASIIELSGRSVRDAANPDGDIEINIEGLRPGEKLYEELLIAGDTVPTAHPRILRSREPYLALPVLEGLLDELRAVIRDEDPAAAREILRRIVVEYVPNSPMVDYLAPPPG